MNICITNATCIQDIIGGASRAVDEIATALVDLGHTVTVFIPNRIPDRPHQEKTSGSYTLVRYKRYSGALSILNPISAYLAFHKIDNPRFDLIWGNSPEPWLYIPKGDRRLIYTMHGPWIEESIADGRQGFLRRIIIKLLYKHLLPNSTTTHFQTSYAWSACLSEGATPSQKTIIAPLLIDESNLKIPPVESLTCPPQDCSKLRILVARRLVNRTGVLQFLSQIQNFEQELQNRLSITIVGNGYLAKKVAALALEIPCAKYLGEVDRKSLDELYASADVTLMPSVTAEGFGVSIIESIQRGTPVAYTNIGGMAETLGKHFPEFSYEPDSPQSLRRLIEQCLVLKDQGKLKRYMHLPIPAFKDSLMKIVNA